MTPEQLAALAAALGLASDAKPDELIAKAKALVADALAPIAESLGLAKTATSDEIVARAKAASADALAPVAEALGLAKTAAPDEILAKAKATAPDLGAYVPRAEFDRVAVRLNTLETERTDERATTAVDEAIAAGKIAPAQRDWALGYAKSNADGFANYVKDAPVIVTPARTGAGPTPPSPDAPLTADELATCKAMGLTAEQFKKSREAIVTRQEGDQ